MREITNVSPQGVFNADEQGIRAWVNEIFRTLSAPVSEQIQKLCRQEIIPSGNQNHPIPQVQIFAPESRPLESAIGSLPDKINDISGRHINLPRGAGQPFLKIRDNDEEVKVQDSTQKKLKPLSGALFQQKQNATAILESIGDALITTDIQNKLIYLNPAAEVMTGWSVAEADGLMFSDIFNIIDAATFQPIESSILRPTGGNAKTDISMDCIFIRRDGTELYVQVCSAPIHDGDARVVGAVHVLHDVSRIQIKAIKMAHSAQYDLLTDLPNRKLLKERLTQAIGLARRKGTHLAVLFIDLDCFKATNDTFGHETGDQLLRAVAVRLRECVRSTDTLCRLGGDEFVVLLTEIEQYQDAAKVAELLHSRFCFPHCIQEHEIRVSLSIGISVYPNDGIDEEALLHNADTAMYRTKALRHNGYLFFTPEMNNSVVINTIVDLSDTEHRLNRPVYK